MYPCRCLPSHTSNRSSTCCCLWSLRLLSLLVYLLAAVAAAVGDALPQDPAVAASSQAGSQSDPYVTDTAPANITSPIWDALMVGNSAFSGDAYVTPNLSSTVRRIVAQGQSPTATVVTCSDSRVIPEYFFDEGIGQIFDVRVAGNVLDEVTLGSIEYGAIHLKTPLLIILGHHGCGAVIAAYVKRMNARYPNITDPVPLSVFKEFSEGHLHDDPAAAAASGNRRLLPSRRWPWDPDGDYLMACVGRIFEAADRAIDKMEAIYGQTGAWNPTAAIELAVQENVRVVCRSVLTNSKHVYARVQAGLLTMVMAEYWMDTGRVNLINGTCFFNKTEEWQDDIAVVVEVVEEEVVSEGQRIALIAVGSALGFTVIFLLVLLVWSTRTSLKRRPPPPPQQQHVTVHASRRYDELVSQTEPLRSSGTVDEDSRGDEDIRTSVGEALDSPPP